MKVAVVGASNNPERYSYKALHLLNDMGYETFPVNPNHQKIEGQKVLTSLEALPEPVHTVTLYVSAHLSKDMGPALLKSRCNRVIFNPGAENPSLKSELEEKGVNCLEACTLVLLKSGVFCESAYR